MTKEYMAIALMIGCVVGSSISSILTYMVLDVRWRGIDFKPEPGKELF